MLWCQGFLHLLFKSVLSEQKKIVSINISSMNRWSGVTDILPHSRSSFFSNQAAEKNKGWTSVKLAAVSKI